MQKQHYKLWYTLKEAAVFLQKQTGCSENNENYLLHLACQNEVILSVFLDLTKTYAESRLQIIVDQESLENSSISMIEELCLHRSVLAASGSAVMAQIDSFYLMDVLLYGHATLYGSGYVNFFNIDTLSYVKNKKFHDIEFYLIDAKLKCPYQLFSVKEKGNSFEKLFFQHRKMPLSNEKQSSENSEESIKYALENMLVLKPVFKGTPDYFKDFKEISISDLIIMGDELDALIAKHQADSTPSPAPVAVTEPAPQQTEAPPEAMNAKASALPAGLEAVLDPTHRDHAPDLAEAIRLWLALYGGERTQHSHSAACNHWLKAQGISGTAANRIKEISSPQHAWDAQRKERHASRKKRD